MIAYPVFILILGLGIAAFLDSTNNNHQVRISSSSLQAQYYAHMGMEYAFCEIKKNAYSDKLYFVTHTVDSQSNALVDAANPSTLMPGTQINADGNYELTSGNNKFEVKVYKKNGATYILSKGSNGNSARLLVNKITGTSLFEYFSFFPGNTAFSWQTLDAQGGKIQVNGDIDLYSGAILKNLSELSSYGKMRLAYYPAVAPGEELYVDEGQFMQRWPYAQSTSYPFTTYANRYDGYYTGQNSGLYIERKDGFITSEDAAKDPLGTDKPVYPWGAGDGIIWAAGDKSYIYEQENINCVGACNLAASHPSINEVSIPSRIAGAPSYNTYQYLGHTDPGDPTISIDLTNSEQQAATWQNFISSFPSAVDLEAGTATGLSGIVKAGQSNGAQYISPPRVNIQDLISQAKDSGKGMSIDYNAGTGQIEVTINDNSPITFSATNGTSFSQDCGSGKEVALFTHHKFINHESGLPNEVVEVNVGGLSECEATAAEQYLPKNGMIYSNYSLALANANQLPEKGLTSIVNGNLILKGQYNAYKTAEEDFWQPSAAIVSNYVYLVSNSFSYPSTLPVTQRHKEYPNAESHGFTTLPAGIGTGATKDYKSGYNWIFNYDSQMANKVPIGVYEYKISLIGTYAPFPQYLERWGYYASPGDNTHAPKSWMEYRPVVIGNFVQLADNVFPPAGNLDSPNYRYCNQAGAGYPSSRQILFLDINGASPFPGSYPCRNSAGSTPDLLAYSTTAEKKYESNYSDIQIRPPGDFKEFQSSIILELPVSPTYWNFHNTILGS